MHPVLKSLFKEMLIQKKEVSECQPLHCLLLPSAGIFQTVCPQAVYEEDLFVTGYFMSGNLFCSTV
jgi:hypothetical protein